MRRVRTYLSTQFFAYLLLTLLVVVGFESDLLTAGGWSGKEYIVAQFYINILMLVWLLGGTPLALYLFKMSVPKAQLSHSKESGHKPLMRWGSLRMALVGAPMVLDFLFYYLFGLKVGFFYMSLVHLLAMFFVYPSEGRCLSEAEPLSKTTSIDNATTKEKEEA